MKFNIWDKMMIYKYISFNTGLKHKTYKNLYHNGCIFETICKGTIKIKLQM